VGASRAGAEIDHRGPVAVVVVLMFMMTVTVVMAMMMLVVIAMMMVPIMVLVAMHGPIGMRVLVGPGLRRAFDGGFARRASANCTHQSTSSSLILSSSPEIICN
jgi:hypothetical protein